MDEKAQPAFESKRDCRFISYSAELVSLARDASLAWLQECATHGSNGFVDDALRSPIAPMYIRYLDALRSESEPYLKAVKGRPGDKVAVSESRKDWYADLFDQVIEYGEAFGVEVPEIIATRFAENDAEPWKMEAGKIRQAHAIGEHWIACTRSGARPTAEGYVDRFDVAHFPKCEMDRSAVEVWWPLIRYYVAPVLLVAPDGILHDFSHEREGYPDPGTGDLPSFGLWDPVKRPEYA